jgi:hypothetical protein
MGTWHDKRSGQALSGCFDFGCGIVEEKVGIGESLSLIADKDANKI